MAQTRKVYFNGRYVEESEARVSIFDSALMSGDMCFEMTRTYKHKPFRMRHHLERLYAGLKIAEIDCGLTIDDMEKATNIAVYLKEEGFLEYFDEVEKVQNPNKKVCRGFPKKDRIGGIMAQLLYVVFRSSPLTGCVKKLVCET